VWFNAALKASGLGSSPVSIHVTHQEIDFTSGGVPYSVKVPDSILNFSSANAVASTSLDAGQNACVTNLPMSWSGNAFLGGATFVANNGLAKGINPVVWVGNFETDAPGVKLNWQWGAAVYTHFSADYNSLNVKPLDSGSATVYQNSDHAGTPEAFKSFVTGGARGGGGSNWTGSYSGTASVTPTVVDFNAPVQLTGRVVDNSGAGLMGVTITLTDDSGTVIAQVITDNNGYYLISNVAPSQDYLLSASLNGSDAVQLTVGDLTTDLDFTLNTDLGGGGGNS